MTAYEVLHQVLLEIADDTKEAHTSTPPPSIIPNVSSKTLTVLDIDSLELARQLTLLEAALYNKIQPDEYLRRSVAGNPQEDNIYSNIQLANKTALWAAGCILEQEDVQKRVALVEHFISIADHCRELQNYSSMVSLISGLNTPPVRRLRQTWKRVGAKFMQQLAACESTIDTDHNWVGYRATLANISPPAVPFVGVYLTTLTNLQIQGGESVDVQKRRIIQDIEHWQIVPYNFNSVPSILSYLDETYSKYEEEVEYLDGYSKLSLEREP